MDTHLHKNLNEILVQKGHFKSEPEARSHVQKLGYQINQQPVHITDNFYKYKQNRPTFLDQQFQPRKDMAVYEFQHNGQKTIGKDHLQYLKHESLKQPLTKQRISAFNQQIKQGNNMVQQAREKRFTGKDGAGIWKYEFMKEKYDQLKQPDIVKSELTPFTKQQPVEIERLRYELPHKVQQQGTDMSNSNGKMAKKYF